MIVKLMTPLGNLVKIKGDKGNVRTELYFLTKNGYRIFEDDEIVSFKDWLKRNFGGKDG